MTRPIDEIRAEITRRKRDLHRVNAELSAAERAGDVQAAGHCRCNRGYVQRALRVLAHEAERSLMLSGDPLTV